MVAVLLRLGPVHLNHVVGPRPRALGHANLRVCEAVPQAERTQRDTTADRREQRVALREQAPPPAGGESAHLRAPNEEGGPAGNHIRSGAAADMVYA